MKLLALTFLLASTIANAAYYPALGGKVLVAPEEIISTEHSGYMLRISNIFFTDDGRVALWIHDKVVFSSGEICDLKSSECIDPRDYRELEVWIK